MTEQDLICEEPFIIGFLGLISFLSFSIGSLTLTDMIDTQGRKQVVVYAALITPLGIFVLLTFANSIYTIYSIMFLIGLTYNPRSSVAYIYGSEFLDSSQRMRFGAYNFTFSGIFQSVSALWFYWFKDQNSYFVFMMVLMLVAI